MAHFTSFFKDSRGRWAVVQPPNLSLVIFFILLAAQNIVAHGKYHNALSALSYGTIFYWSLQEILRGASGFRRLLGLSVLVLSTLMRSL